MQHVDATRTLLLTQGYEPIQIISWQRAMTLVALDKVEIVERYPAEVRAVSVVVQVPAVIRLRRAFRRHARLVKFSRVNIYARDGYRCQYCGVRCTVAELTFDHVMPRSRGGRTNWENIVACCYACNARKANRTPAEARMALRAVPVRPAWLPSVQLRTAARSMPDAWQSYVYWTAELEHDPEGHAVSADPRAARRR